MYWVSTLVSTTEGHIWSFDKLDDAIAKMTEFTTLYDTPYMIHAMLETYNRYAMLTETTCVALYKLPGAVNRSDLEWVPNISQ